MCYPTSFLHCLRESWASLSTLGLERNGCLFADGIFRCIFLKENGHILIKIWSLFLNYKLRESQHWFRWWLGIKQATSHDLNQWWLSSVTPYCVTRPKWIHCVQQKSGQKLNISLGPDQFDGAQLSFDSWFIYTNSQQVLGALGA